MKSNEFINENIVMDAHEMHKDHEVQMARKDCYHAAEDAIALHKLLRNVSEEQGVESWVFAKITLANDYLRTVREYMEYNLMNPDQSAGMAAEPTPEMPIAENASSGASGAGNMAGVNNPKTKKAKSKVGTLFGGTYKAKGSPFAESKKTNVKPGQSGLDKILASYPQEVESFKNGGDLDYDLEAALWEYYNSRGEWNDKYDATGWISKQLARYLSRKNKGVAEAVPNSDMDFDRRATTEYALKMQKALRDKTSAPVSLFYNKDNSITLIVNPDLYGNSSGPDAKGYSGDPYGNYGASEKNIHSAIDPYYHMFRQKGWRFDQPIQGRITFGVPVEQQGVAEGYSLKKIKREK